MSQFPRRDFLRISASALTAAVLPRHVHGQDDRRKFQLSLSERSLTRQLAEGEIDHLDFAKLARNEFEFEAIDYASRFFKDQVDDDAYLTNMNKHAADQGVRQVLLLVDGEGSLGAKDNNVRTQAIRNHRRWIRAAQALGCRAVCIQVTGDGPPKEQAPRVIEALGRLSDAGSEHKVNVLVSNDIGPASDPAWLRGVLKKVDSSHCAAFPLFSGFGGRDRYEGMAQLMNVAKGVCATSEAFNGDGYETNIDYNRMMTIVLEAGYRGYVSLEYQGKTLDEFAGIRATKSLLQRFLENTT